MSATASAFEVMAARVGSGAGRLRRPDHGGSDCGAATVLAVALVVCVLALTAGGLVIASAVVASHRARLAADLAALAGAGAGQDGADPSRACAVAQDVARRNGAATRSCSAGGGVLDVRVTVPSGLWPAPAEARARAGPEP